MKNLKKLAALFLCAIFVFFAVGCDNYSTRKGDDYIYSLGEKAEILYSTDSDKNILIATLCIDKVEYEDKNFTEDGIEYKGICTLDFSYDLVEKIDAAKSLNFSSSQFEVTCDGFTKSQKEDIPDGKIVLYEKADNQTFVISLKYKVAEYTSAKFSIKLDNTNLASYTEGYDNGYANGEADAKRTMQDILDQRTTTLGTIIFLLVIALVTVIASQIDKVSKNSLPGTDTEEKNKNSETTQEETDTTNTKSRRKFKKEKRNKPCCTSFTLSVISLVLLFAFLVTFKASEVFSSIFFYTMMVVSIVAFIIKSKRYERHGLELLGLLVSLFFLFFFAMDIIYIISLI